MVSGSAFFPEKGEPAYMSEMAKKRGRMAIYMMAGIYLLFMAYNLVKELPYSSGNQKILNIVFIIFFGVVGAAMVIMGLVKGYKLSQPSGTNDALQEKDASEGKTGASDNNSGEE